MRMTANIPVAFYEAPAVQVVHLKTESIICASNGETQDYDAGSIFSAGTDNEG